MSITMKCPACGRIMFYPNDSSIIMCGFSASIRIFYNGCGSVFSIGENGGPIPLTTDHRAFIQKARNRAVVERGLNLMKEQYWG